jgi:hypothetical protein
MPTAYGKLIIDAQTRLQAPANNSICQVLGLALGLQGPMWQWPTGIMGTDNSLEA